MRACLRPCRERLGDVEREGRECARWRWRLRWRSREATAGGGNGSGERSRERNEWRDSAAAADAAALAEAAGASSCDRRSVHFCFSSRSLSVSLSLSSRKERRKRKQRSGFFPLSREGREKKKVRKKTSSTLLALFFFFVFLPLCSLFSPRHPAPPRAWNPSADFAWRAVKRTELFIQVRPLAKKQAQRARRRAPAGGVGEGHLKRKRDGIGLFLLSTTTKGSTSSSTSRNFVLGVFGDSTTFAVLFRFPLLLRTITLGVDGSANGSNWRSQGAEATGKGRAGNRKMEACGHLPRRPAAERKEKCKLFIPR